MRELSIAGSYYAAYEHYSGILRTWLVAYGIGSPVVMLTKDRVWNVLALKGVPWLIGTLFLTGVAAQVIIAATNKAVMWASYYGEDHPKFQTTKRYRFARWLRGQFWIDLSADVGTIVLFTAATIRVFVAMTKGP